ncbi:MAG: hypothetical protein WCI76_03475 [bacterium]
MKKNIQKGISKGKMVVASGMAAIGAGAYYLLGPDAKKNQKKAKVLIDKISKEVKTKSKEAKDVWNEISK